MGLLVEGEDEIGRVWLLGGGDWWNREGKGDRATVFLPAEGEEEGALVWLLGLISKRG